MPPNTTGHYDYLNTAAVASDIEDWRPDGSGETRIVSVSTWRDLTYDWPGEANFPQKTESQWYLYWMQNFPGSGNSIPHGTSTMSNWWEFIANWDRAIADGLGLYSETQLPHEETGNKSPTLKIEGGDRVISDTDRLYGEVVSFSATAVDSDGSITASEWLVNDMVVADGLTPSFQLPDGTTRVTLRSSDDDGAISTTSVTITVDPPPLPDGWPFQYSGITPHESLRLGLNNIGILYSGDGLIYSCLSVFSDGARSDFAGVPAFDVAFAIVVPEQATIEVVKAKPFNEAVMLTDEGSLPDCSGKIDLVTNIYSDTIQAGKEVFEVEFELFDTDNLRLRLLEITMVGTVP